MPETDDVVLNPRDNHGISVGDVIEVFHPEDQHRVLFLVKNLREDFQFKEDKLESFGVVFRSNTSVVHIFIQMSHEMWIFDEYGHLYFEKALSFLNELMFNSWIVILLLSCNSIKESNCNHDVTIVLFLRIFISANGLDDILEESFHKDFHGRYYEDFYKVILQNERFVAEEKKSVLPEINMEFNELRYSIVKHLQRYFDSSRMPTLLISSSIDGNFLETLNMALN
ncbi:unnamed protein product, partial [Protopolystoma xenopodis]